MDREQCIRDHLATLPPLTPDERDLQRLSFAYGNLAATTNHKPSRSAFERFATEQLGWSAERFKTWADEREWEVR